MTNIVLFRLLTAVATSARVTPSPAENFAENGAYMIAEALLLSGFILLVCLSARCVHPFWTTTLSLSSCALLFLSSLFGLSLLHDIAVLAVFLMMIALTVVYQTELRETLSGVFSFTRHHGGKNKQAASAQVHSDAIDAVCQAVVDLSRNKTGALIVLERMMKLDDISRSGVEIDAKVSPYLLRNIFFNKAPLHDGAVIVRNSRIASAACILPLTLRTDVDPDLGTRHRAAIGMSEISDAVIVVVSEETGTISVAYHSTLTRDFSYQALRATLSKLLLNREVSGDD